MRRFDFPEPDSMDVDVEDELDRFSIINPYKQPLPQTHLLKATENVQNKCEFVPLLLRDIQNLKSSIENSNILRITLQSEEIYVRSCILHALVVAKVGVSKSFYKYLIDDGTASLEVNFFNNANVLRSIAQLQLENSVWKKTSTLDNAEDIANSLRRLLLKSIEQLDGSMVPIGKQILIHGRPKLYREKIVFDVFSFCKDDGISRGNEIAFKNYLLSWYTKANAQIKLL